MEEKLVEELTLLLLHLTSWVEKGRHFSEPARRCWKTFRFEILDELEAKGLINQGKKSKSVWLTDEGIKRAEELKRKYRAPLAD